MAYCSDCGAMLTEGARFCHICGKEVNRTPYCPQCSAALPEGSRFCSFCGTSLNHAAAPAPAVPVPRPAPAPTPAPVPMQPRAHHQGRPPTIPMPAPTPAAPRTIRIPAPEVKPQPPRTPVPPPQTAPLEGVVVPAVVNTHPFTGSVQRFFGTGGSFYSFQGSGMYGYLEPFSMNYTAGQGPMTKGGGNWFFHANSAAEGIEVPALSGAQILSSAPEGMYVYLNPTIYFVAPDGTMRPFIEAAETLTDMVCFESWLFVTYLGPFEEGEATGGSVQCCDRSYVVAYDRASGDAAAIFERCAGIFYIDQRIVILCDLLDNGEISRNVYKTPVHGWTEDGFRTLANYVGRIRGSLPFSRLILDNCGGRGNWKTPTECTANLRCCDWRSKCLAFQQKGSTIWRDFSGRGAEKPQDL